MLVLKVLGFWIALSCTAGLLFTWTSFYPVHREDEMRGRGRSEGFQRSCCIHQFRPRHIVEFPTADESELGSQAIKPKVCDWKHSMLIVMPETTIASMRITLISSRSGR
jgi:hypothetical protein